MALINKLGAIGDAIREKTGGTQLLTLDAMPAEILAIETGGGGGGDLPEEALNITGDCSYRFAYDGWSWFIKEYGDKVKTKDLLSMAYMFHSSTIEYIPFDLNGYLNAPKDMNYIFTYCKQLKKSPKITGQPTGIKSIYSNCEGLQEVLEEDVAGIDWSYIDSLPSTTNGDRGNTFNACCSLRKYPNSFLAHGNPYSRYSSSIYYYLFYTCYLLDEIVDLPIQHRKASWTSSAMTYLAGSCYRIKRLTFETNEDGTPIAINTWSKQTLDLSASGYTVSKAMITKYGLTEETLVTDDATYQALKDNPDWWAADVNYARYNKASAVETINTLPDLSGGAGGNTIKFKGAAGALTDGGAINTLTEEEIAVAAAKGWTVTLV